MNLSTTLILSIAVFLGIVLLLVGLLLFVRNKLMPKGKMRITINGEKELEVQPGSSLMATLAEEKVFLPSACGGKGNCGQCKCRVTEGGESILPTEVGFFSRKQIQEHWRLGCQVKVKEDMKIVVPQSILSIKEYECTVVSNRNVATFIKEFKVQLPASEHMDFVPGSYAQIKIPAFDLHYSDFDKELIGAEYLPAWEKFKMFDLHCVNTEPTVRAYSMANYPAEGDVFMLTVRIATPPFKVGGKKSEVGAKETSSFMNVNPGIASSYIFSLKPGDKVLMSGPFGEFHVKEHDEPKVPEPVERPTLNSKLPEMIWVGGGAGMAPLRAQIMHLTRTMNVRDREMHYFYGARALNEVFYLNDFRQLEQDFPNFHFHLALDRPDPAADAVGVPYTAGFVHNVMYDTYLKNHPAPEDIEYYMCGPGPMSAAVVKMLDNLGVPAENILYDDFGGGAPKK
ncbi:MAG: NADH:ubiquinone reductase (Na(+)-transporting) subunit F [Bacteroidales bacterium]|nr:NADH:ubiquinone reductase (Na(+)-transporting) subunit F [Bacteroidales bacterium]